MKESQITSTNLYRGQLMKDFIKSEEYKLLSELLIKEQEKTIEEVIEEKSNKEFLAGKLKGLKYILERINKLILLGDETKESLK